MPIHDIGYRRWTGTFGRRWFRWWPIVRRGVPLLLRSKVLIVMLVFCLLFTVVAQLLTIVQLMSGSTLMSVWFVKGYMDWMMMFSVTLLVFAGASQISDDLRANAFQIYGARAISWFDYYKAKFCIVSGVLLLTTLLPGVCFYLFGVGSQLMLPPISQIAWSLLAISCYALVITTTLSALILALSALGQTAWYAGVVWLGIYMLPWLLVDDLAAAMDSATPYYFSVHHLLAHVGWECAGWARITQLDWLQLPLESLRGLAKGDVISLLGRTEMSDLFSKMAGIGRVQQMENPDELRALLLEGMRAIEVVPERYEAMDLRVTLGVLAGGASGCVLATLARLRRAVISR